MVSEKRGSSFKSVISENMFTFDDNLTLVQVKTLVPPGNKILPELMVTQIYVAMC